MPNPVTFSSSTPNIGLPLLIAGQAQKEFFVNQALAIIDALDRRAVVASMSQPPSDPGEGSCYRVTAPAAQAWEGCEDHIAVQVAGAWHLVPPRDGMRLFDLASGQSLLFRDGWQASAPVPAPAGGTVVDIEARAALSSLIEVLRETGIVAPPA